MRPEDGGNQLYGVTIINFRKTGSIIVKAHTPDDITLKLGSRWSSPYGELGQAGGVNRFAAMFGTTFTMPSMTSLVWTGMSSPIISLRLKWHAETDAYREVVEPIARLIEMIVPHFDGHTLTLPGPTIAGQIGADIANNEYTRKITESVDRHFGTSIQGRLNNLKDNEKILFRFGRTLTFEDVVLGELNINIPTKFTSDGLPIEVSADITIQPFKMLYRDDILKLFNTNTDMPRGDLEG